MIPAGDRINTGSYLLPGDKEKTMKLSGKISSIIYTTGTYAVIRMTVTDGENLFGEHTIVAAGSIFNPQPNMRIDVEGEYTNHPKYGTQFSVTSSFIKVDNNKPAVIRSLTMGGFRGIGPKTAAKIVEHFGENVVEEIIEKDPARLAEIKGITTEKALLIGEAHKRNFALQELSGMNITESQMRKLYDCYKEKAVTVMKTDPYQAIYDIPGFGFRTVDGIAIKNGIQPNDPKRIGAALIYILSTISNDGHCWCTMGALIDHARELLYLSPAIIETQLNYEIQSGHIICDSGRIYAKYLYRAEDETARWLAHLATCPPIVDISDRTIERAICLTEDQNGFELDESQRKAVVSALRNRVSVITGGPGTGKSTITKAIINAWMDAMPNVDDPEDCITLCAPTGKAARRMFEVTGVQAQTAQRLVVRFDNCGVCPSGSLIILDEASMVDITLAHRLLEIAKEDNQLVLIGDVDQLPPIGPGNFFRDCIQSPFIQSVKLELSHRQKGYVAINAQRINEGKGTHALKLDDPSFRFVPADKSLVREKVIEEYLKLYNEVRDLSEICCVVPMRKSGKSQTSADDLNVILRDHLNPAKEGAKTIKGCKYRIGDRVMQTENDYDRDIYNGDCGTIISMDTEDQLLIMKTDDGRLIEYTVQDTQALVFAYCVTIHKVQGSQYKSIVVAHSMEHFYMLQRNLLYTAVTRAKEKVVIVGEDAAINTAVKKVPSLDRNTSLRIRIKNYILAQEHS